jgi:hypothetical protein
MRRAIRVLQTLRRQYESMGDGTMLCECDEEQGIVCFWCAPVEDD